MDLTELEKLIKTRRSVRSWQQSNVPDELLRKAIEVAAWAPSGGNHQPWKFLVVKNKGLITDIADAVQAKTDLIASWPGSEEFAEDVARWKENSSFFRTAPVCIAVLLGQYESTPDKILKKRGSSDPAAREILEARYIGRSGLQSIAAAIAYLLLVLHQMGLGAVWMGGPQQAKGDIERLLNIPSGWDFVALIPVGYPAESPTALPRKPLNEVMEFIT